MPIPATTKYWLALNSVNGVGPKTVRMLISRFGSPKEILSASIIDISQMTRLNLPLAKRIIEAGEKLTKFEKLITLMSKSGIQVLCPDNREYPELLKNIDDSPPILYRKGRKLVQDKTTIAIVGTRSASNKGIKAACDMAERLAGKDIAIISGMARGIDTAAHKGALQAGGQTVAVLGSGLKMIYPRENCQLADNICINGSIVSECHPNELVSGQRLIQRNRITSGLAQGVILVEPRRGAMNTAKRAIGQKRHVFMYAPEGQEIPSSLSSAISPICGIDELDNLVKQVQEVEAEDSQISLL